MEFHVKPRRLGEVRDRLAEVGVVDFLVSEIRESGPEGLTPKLRLEVFLPSDLSGLMEPLLADLVREPAADADRLLRFEAGLFDEADPDAPPAPVWRGIPPGPAADGSVTVLAGDIPAPLSRASGALDRSGFDIRHGRWHRRRNAVYGRFGIRDASARSAADSAEAFDRAGECFRRGEEIPIPEARVPTDAIRPRTAREAEIPEIEIRDGGPSRHTAIQVLARDGPGLLHVLSDAIEGLGLCVWNAMIATGSDQAFNLFYVSDAEGRNVASPGRASEIRCKLREAAARRAAPGAPESTRNLFSSTCFGGKNEWQSDG